jgi:hypothetical protein
MSDETVIDLLVRRKELRRTWRRLAGSAAAYLAPAPADEGQPRGVVVPFRTRAEPLLGHFSRFERLAAAARSQDAAPDAPTQPSRPVPLEIRWTDAAEHRSRGALKPLFVRWTRPEASAPDSGFIRPVLTVIAGGRAERELGAQPIR